MFQNHGIVLRLSVIKKLVIKSVRYRHKYIFAMDKAYLKYVDSSDVFYMNFHYTNSALKVDRTFNFSRKVTENVESFLNRICTNVEKVISKKLKRKRNDKEKTSEITVTAELFGNSGTIDKCAICQDVFKQNNLILTVLEKQYKIMKNCPWVDSICLSNVLLANYPVYPNKFEVSFTNKDLCEFIWYKSKDKKEWIRIGEGFLMQLSNNEINYYLKLQCIPKNDDLIGPLTEVVSDVVVQASPGLCSFDIRHQFTKSKPNSKEFRVVTYNVLADLYSDSDFSRNILYPYCPAYALHIDYRKLLIIKELIGYNADIICLQEVDKKVYENDLQPVLSNFGYQSDLCLKGGQVAEGLACFYNEQRFRMLGNQRIV
ncbi:2',5'-phosphodiesterase 12 isoform X2 [Agrilus planipennis]|uniref:2',5'-phosphodiesterase 12 isoform X2 n=1 Tax=Agrilus planipennis TaxID=224129 RepID=A0A1W4WRB0_AGRPL|nr:2',5'-phosphodiesterase 12 isoform X2 [Agrilus planipennis]